MKKNNNEKRKWYFLIAVALLVGAIVGYFATQSLSTTGNAKEITENTKRLKQEEEYQILNNTIIEIKEQQINKGSKDEVIDSLSDIQRIIANVNAFNQGKDNLNKMELKTFNSCKNLYLQTEKTDLDKKELFNCLDDDAVLYKISGSSSAEINANLDITVGNDATILYDSGSGGGNPCGSCGSCGNCKRCGKDLQDCCHCWSFWDWLIALILGID